MMVIDESEQEQLRCLYGKKAIWAYRHSPTIHISSATCVELRNVYKRLTGISRVSN